MFKIPESQSKVYIARKGGNVADPHRQFGGEKQAVSPALRIPDVAGVQYQGDMAKANAINSVANDAGNVWQQVDREKQVSAGTQAETYALELQRELTNLNKVVDNDAEVNGWTPEQRETEYKSKRGALVDVYKAKDVGHNKVQKNYMDSMPKFLAGDDINYDKHISNVRLDVIKNSLKKNDELRLAAVAETNDANVVVDAIARQSATIQIHANASLEVSQEMADSEKANMVNNYVSTFLSGVLMDNDYDTAVSSLEAFSSRYTEIDKSKAMKVLRSLNVEKLAAIETAQNKHDATYLGTFNLSLETGKNIPTEPQIMSAGMKDNNTAIALASLHRYQATFAENTINNDYIDKMRIEDPEHFMGDTSTKTGKQVDVWFEDRADIYSDLYQQNPAAAYVQMSKDVASVGIVPSAFRGLMTKLINSNDPEQIKFGAVLISSLEKESPQLIAQDFKHYEKEVITADLISSGVDPLDSQNMAKQFSLMDKTAKKDRMNEALDDVGNPTEQVEDALEASDVLDWEIFGTPKIPESAKEDYRKLYSHFYVAYGDKSLAESRAQKIIANTWGRTNIDGSDRLMKNSPEQVYGGGYESEWMKTQLEYDLSTVNDQLNNVTIMANPKTANSKQPTYYIWDNDNGGYVLDANNMPMAWKPDKAVFNAGEQERLRLETERKKTEIKRIKEQRTGANVFDID